jgi:hypothetical protein
LIANKRFELQLLMVLDLILPMKLVKPFTFGEEAQMQPESPPFTFGMVRPG